MPLSLALVIDMILFSGIPVVKMALGMSLLMALL